ncbi:MAG TPA: GGDEF domain-containing protein [Polyangia bacterium]
MNLLIPTKKDPMQAYESGDLSERVLHLEEQNARLRRSVARLRVYRNMAYRDPLTGLWNRRYFEERLKEEFSRAERAGVGRSFSVGIVDLNGFKEINDQHGHLVGDEVLKWVGNFLTTRLRTHDVACRTGGDEFMLLLPDLSAADAVHVIARLRVQLREANLGLLVPVSLSIGSASWPEVSKGCDMLLASADAAMYEDKRAQKSRLRQRDYRSAA